MRLHKFIANAGLTSRRKAEDLIKEGRVTVNGDVVDVMGVLVAEDDDVRVDGKPLLQPRMYYLVMNKPKGLLTTSSDPFGRETVMKLLPDLGVALKPVGRLDKDTEGLLIFTNDGDLAMRLTHPRFGIEKEYLAIVSGSPDAKDLERIRKGIYIDGKRTMPAQAELKSFDEKSQLGKLSLILHEGRKRQVRLMCEAIGHPVVSLKRVRIGHLRLRDMAPGECRALGKSDISKLNDATQVGQSDSQGPRKSTRIARKTSKKRT